MSVFSVSTKNDFSGGKSVEKGGSQLTGRQQIVDFVMYTLNEKFDYKNGQVKMNAHEGASYFISNSKLDMLNPFEMSKLKAFKSKAEFKQYMHRYAEEAADEFLSLTSVKEQRKGGNRFDAGRFIISLTKDELKQFKTDKERADFLNLLAHETFMRMSNCTKIEDINFYYRAVPHLKDKNPHIHLMFSSYTFDGKSVDFYRGNSTHGFIKFLNDVKFDMEEKYPNLLQMEHEKRAKEVKTLLENQELKAGGADAELLESLKALKAKYSGSNYYHKEFKKEFDALGFKTKFQKKPKEVLVSFKDGEFKSLKNLDFELKRLIEKYDEMEHAQIKSHSDISKIIYDATKLINSSTHNIEDLNKILKSKFGVMVCPSEISRHKTTGEYLYSKWSIHMIDEGVKFSAQKYGIQIDKIITTLAAVKQMQKEIQTLENETKEKLKARGYEKKNRREMTSVQMLEGETFEEYKTRQEKENMKSALLMLQKEGNDMFGTNHKKMMSLLSPNEINVYRGGERACVQMYIAKGFRSIEFVGDGNAEIQKQMYIECVLHGLKVKNYTPSSEAKAIAQQGLDTVYQQLIGKNIGLIDAKIAELKSIREKELKTGIVDNEDKKTVLLYLKTNYKFEIDVDVRPKIYGYLYGVYNELHPEVFAHMQTLLKETPKDVLKSVVADFQLAETLTDENMAIVLKACGIDLSDSTVPVYELPKPHNPESGPKPKPSQQAPGTDAPKETTPAATQQQEPKPVVTYPAGTKPPTTQAETQQQAQEDAEKKERDRKVGQEALNKLKKNKF